MDRVVTGQHGDGEGMVMTYMRSWHGVKLQERRCGGNYSLRVWGLPMWSLGGVTIHGTMLE